MRRLGQAGAIIVGKSNVAFMLADFGQTANELYGTTNNPWDTPALRVVPAVVARLPSRRG